MTYSRVANIALPQVGFGLHYIHSTDLFGKLETTPNLIPSEGMAHPLMTTTWKGYAN